MLVIVEKIVTLDRDELLPIKNIELPITRNPSVKMTSLRDEQLEKAKEPILKIRFNLVTT